MATNYPSSLDNSTTLPAESANTPLSTNHVTAHQNIQDALEAIETKLGIDSSADTNSIDYKLKSTSSSNPGHKHTLANGATDVTASASELNILDGATLSTTELNYVDGVTSSIQSQLDLKALDSAVVHDTGAESIDGVKTFTSDPIIPDEAYGSGWNGVLEPPTKNAVYDKIETLIFAISEQDIPYYNGATAGYASTLRTSSSISGDVLFAINVVSNVGTIYRFIRDTASAQYILTHTVTLTPSSSVDNYAMCVTTNYLYVGYSDGGTKKIARFDIATLANQTAITISGTNWTQGSAGFSDGTNIYIANSSNTFAKYTISGTTATYDSDITYTSAGDVWNGSATSDGTNVFTCDDTGAGTNPIVIKKYALAGGSSTGTVSRYFITQAYNSSGRITFYIPKAGAIGIGYGKVIDDETAIEGASLKLSAIAQP